MAHRLIAYDLGAERFAIVLAPAHIKSFIEKLAGNPKTRQRANAIVKAMAQIAKSGTSGHGRRADSDFWAPVFLFTS